MKHHLTIDDETMTVLRASTVTASSVKLPPGQLPRPLYVKVNKVLETAGGKWNRAQQAHIFTDDPRETLGLAVASGAILDTKKATQAFYTPEAVARSVVHLASVDGKTVLEPSAGVGALALECRQSGGSVTCVESNPTSCDKLKALRFVALCADFLQCSHPRDLSTFDRVVMNPPFTAGQDIAHVTHAFGFLKRGGRLVSITSPSWETTQNKKATAFRELVRNYGYISERLSAGAFKESGTEISTLILILDKP